MSVTWPAPVHIYVAPSQRDCPVPHLPCPYVSNEGWRCGKTPHKCPVCNGVGQVSGGYFDRAGDKETWASGHTMEPCRRCNGTGIMWG